eukprot:m.247952 g.247952  ORF g.247952 m.247952 type:complete len:76 (+) comp26663_c1_seq7:108-335(+)
MDSLTQWIFGAPVAETTEELVEKDDWLLVVPGGFDSSVCFALLFFSIVKTIGPLLRVFFYNVGACCSCDLVVGCC